MSKEIKNMAYYKAKHAASEKNSPLQLGALAASLIGGVVEGGVTEALTWGKKKDAKKLSAGQTETEAITNMPKVGV
tara:strand:- start:310 stop:537 length:228 start_codon:yes stop_codon:yes gene_type:complete